LVDAGFDRAKAALENASTCDWHSLTYEPLAGATGLLNFVNP
jgi:hypothetical protein